MIEAKEAVVENIVAGDIFPYFEFIDASLVRPVATANIACLNPCTFLEDCIQYHDELSSKGRYSREHKKVHDIIGMANCEDSAQLSPKGEFLKELSKGCLCFECLSFT